MNQSLNIHYARARQDEIQRLISGREMVDEWQPAPPGRWIDRMGRSLVHLGTRTAVGKALIVDYDEARARERYGAGSMEAILTRRSWKLVGIGL